MKMTLTTLFMGAAFAYDCANASDNPHHPTMESFPLAKLAPAMTEIKETDTILTTKEEEILNDAFMKHKLSHLIGQIKPHDENTYITTELFQDIPLSILQKMSNGNKLELMKRGTELELLKQDIENDPQLLHDYNKCIDYYERLKHECALIDAEIDRLLVGAK